MTEYSVKQIWPNHADHISYYKEKYLNDMFKNETVVAQPKYDGERMLIHFDGKEVYCTSRRYSKKTGRFMENQDKLPYLTEAWKKANIDIGYTVIDCECYSKDWSTIVGILHSLPDRAASLQNETTVKYAAFDCLFYNGEDIREKPYFERLFYLKEFLKTFEYEQIHIVGKDVKLSSFQIFSQEDWKRAMEDAINQRFEGIVIKSLDRKYYDKGASLKCKKFETVDCVVINYQQGRGKYENTVGALEIGYYDEEKDKLVKISNVNCGSDEERNMWRDRWTELQYSVIEVKCQEITDRSLRHPVYIRLRKDKDYKMCTRNTIFKE